MKQTIFAVLTASICFGTCCIAIGQAPVEQSEQITDDGSQQIIQDDSSSTGEFSAVPVGLSASSDVALHFPSMMASKPVVVQPIDGGKLLRTSSTIGADGSLSFAFQVTDH